MKQRIKLSKWAKMNGYTYHGAYKVFRAGKIPNAIQTETGSVLVEVESEDNSMNPIGRQNIESYIENSKKHMSLG